MKRPILVLSWFFLSSSLVLTSSGEVSRSEPDETTREILDCSAIRIAEQFYVLKNIDRDPKNQKIRSWLIKRIEHELHMMETVALTKKQRTFVREVKQQLAKQKSL